MNRRFRIPYILVIVLACLHSCSGCSNSGRAQLRKENNNSRTINTVKKQKLPESEHPKSSNSDNRNTATVAQLFSTLQKGVFMVYALDSDGSGSQGSGFFINDSGIGITNYHVLQGHDNYIVKTEDGNKYKIIEILESSPPERNDYVIFKTEKSVSRFYSLPVANETSEIGDDVFVIGSPKGLENSLTKGSISQYRENNRIQIDATIDHGSSGGPLFNMAGEVIGITSGGIEGSALNFAVDIQVVPYKRFIKKKDLTKHERRSADAVKSTNVFDFHPSSSSGVVVHHQFYSLSYVEAHELAEWVAFRMHPEIQSSVGRTNNFRDDPLIVTKSASPYDYRNTGYDRGHLAPAETMSFSLEAMSESFYMSNISPQDPSFNKGIWKRIEGKMRYWADANDSTFVITGPVLKEPMQEIGRNKVSVPSSYYKIMLAYNNGSAKAIAFLVPNQASDKSLYSFVVTIDEVEELTGLDFFASFNESKQHKLESLKDIKQWFIKN